METSETVRMSIRARESDSRRGGVLGDCGRGRREGVGRVDFDAGVTRDARYLVSESDVKGDRQEEQGRRTSGPVSPST